MFISDSQAVPMGCSLMMPLSQDDIKKWTSNGNERQDIFQICLRKTMKYNSLNHSCRRRKQAYYGIKEITWKSERSLQSVGVTALLLHVLKAAPPQMVCQSLQALAQVVRWYLLLLIPVPKREVLILLSGMPDNGYAWNACNSPWTWQWLHRICLKKHRWGGRWDVMPKKDWSLFIAILCTMIDNTTHPRPKKAAH